MQQAIKPLGVPSRTSGVSWGFSADTTHKIQMQYAMILMKLHECNGHMQKIKTKNDNTTYFRKVVQQIKLIISNQLILF